jgi:hypothetical protein
MTNLPVPIAATVAWASAALPALVTTAGREAVEHAKKLAAVGPSAGHLFAVDCSGFYIRRREAAQA